MHQHFLLTNSRHALNTSDMPHSETGKHGARKNSTSVVFEIESKQSPEIPRCKRHTTNAGLVSWQQSSTYFAIFTRRQFFYQTWNAIIYLPLRVIYHFNSNVRVSLQAMSNQSIFIHHMYKNSLHGSVVIPCRLMFVLLNCYKYSGGKRGSVVFGGIVSHMLKAK